MAKRSKTSTSSQADSRVRTSQSPEREQALKERGLVFGQKCTGLLAIYDPDTSSLKTSQCSLFGGEQELLATLPKQGMMRNGRLLGQTTLVRGTGGNGFGLWPTPNAWDGQRGPRSMENLKTKNHQISLVTAVRHNLEPSLEKKQEMFRTPNTMDGMEFKSQKALDHEYTHRQGRAEPNNLRDQIAVKEGMRTWPTPRVGGQEKYDTRAKRKGHTIAMSYLESAVDYHEKFPTPTASEKSGINPKTGRGSGLSKHAKMFPTPTVQDGENDGGPSQYKRHSIPLNAIVKDSPQTTGSLNPTWVEWLMGFPLEWTNLKDSETQ